MLIYFPRNVGIIELKKNNVKYNYSVVRIAPKLLI